MEIWAKIRNKGSRPKCRLRYKMGQKLHLTRSHSSVKLRFATNWLESFDKNLLSCEKTHGFTMIAK